MTSTTTHRFGGRLRLCGHGDGCGGGGQRVWRRYDSEWLPDSGHRGRKHDSRGGRVHGVRVHRPVVLEHILQVTYVIDHVMDHLKPGYPLVLGYERYQILELRQILLDLLVFQVAALALHTAAGHHGHGRTSVVVAVIAAAVVVIAAHRYGFHGRCRRIEAKRNETNRTRVKIYTPGARRRSKTVERDEKKHTREHCAI